MNLIPWYRQILMALRQKFKFISLSLSLSTTKTRGYKSFLSISGVQD